MSITPESQAQIQLWREKAAKGEMSLDEFKEVIKHLRQGRERASVTSTESKTKRASSKAKANINSDDLLSDLENL